LPRPPATRDLARRMLNPFTIARRLNGIGLMGIGRRNAEFVLQYNPRRNYPRVDDKLLTKQLAIQAGLPVPDLYAEVRAEYEIADLNDKPAAVNDGFEVKTVHGSGGDGILVISGRKGDRYRRGGGSVRSRGEFEHHLSNGLSGLF